MPLRVLDRQAIQLVLVTVAVPRRNLIQLLGHERHARQLGIDFARNEVPAGERLQQVAQRLPLLRHQLENQDGGDEAVVGEEVVAEVVVSRDLAAEDGVGFAHPALEKRVADAVHHRRAAVSADGVLDRVAGAEIVDDAGPGIFQQKGFRQQRGDEVAGHEIAGPVDEEAAVRVAVPGDAHIRLLGDDAVHDVAAVLRDERIGFVVRKAAVDVEAQPRRATRQPIEEPRRDESAHAAAGVEHDVERPDDRRIDERHDVTDVLVERVLRRDGAAPPRRRRDGVAANHLADLGQTLVAAERERLAAHHLHPVVLFRIVRGGDLDAAVVAVAGDREIQHVGRDHAVVGHVGALGGRAVDECGGQRRRGQAHVAADGDSLRMKVGHERRTDGTRGFFVDFGRVHAADVVGLEDRRIDPHGFVVTHHCLISDCSR